MRVMTWNVNQRQSRETAVSLCRLIDEEADADIVALQEVSWGRDEDYERELRKRGYQWFYSRKRHDDRLYGSGLAVRKSLGDATPNPRLQELPFPELATCVAVPGVGTILSIHIPNGAGNGWKKIETWEVLIDWFDAIEGPVIFAGDFNAPGVETAERTFCYGYNVLWEGRRTDALGPAAATLGHEQAAALDPQLFKKWTFDGVTDTGERWENAEGWIYDPSRGHGLIDAYRKVRGFGKQEDAYSHFAGHKTPVRYDHVFLRGLTPASAEYRVAWLEERWSDHAPLIVRTKR